MIQANGAEATQKWAEGLMSNLARKPAGGDTANFAQQQLVNVTSRLPIPTILGV